MTELVLDAKRQELLQSSNHLLVLGGPGSGKTTIALLKAQEEIRLGNLRKFQKILFLSFSRATVARVIEQIGKILTKEEKELIEVNTYHGFAWNLLKTHGYLLKSDRKLRLLPPPEASSKMAEIDLTARDREKHRLFQEEGLIHFDIFAEMCVRMLSVSTSIARITSSVFPIIILDEFQDTDPREWEILKIIGKESRLVALADPDQRIYEFRGADPKRIADYIKEFSPISFDFGLENNRSNGTDIATFGNDLITGANKGKSYENVKIIPYQLLSGNGGYVLLKSEILKTSQRFKKNDQKDWSIAILVPSKSLMLEVSLYLGEEQQFTSGGRFPPISHDVSLEGYGPALAFTLIARILESTSKETMIPQFIDDIRTYLLGRKGDIPTKPDLKLAGELKSFLATKSARKNTNLYKIIGEIEEIANKRLRVSLTGHPREDWIEIGKLLVDSPIKIIQELVQDARYLRLLHKGSLLNANLSELWRLNGSYKGATQIIDDAFRQEHFSASVKQWRGINVMTMHKAKGKEFDEVFVFEGFHKGRILVGDTANDVAQAKLKLRVGVTRARQQTTILTPEKKMCPLLY